MTPTENILKIISIPKEILPTLITKTLFSMFRKCLYVVEDKVKLTLMVLISPWWKKLNEDFSVCCQNVGQPSLNTMVPQWSYKKASLEWTCRLMLYLKHFLHVRRAGSTYLFSDHTFVTFGIVTVDPSDTFVLINCTYSCLWCAIDLFQQNTLIV